MISTSKCFFKILTHSPLSLDNFKTAILAHNLKTCFRFYSDNIKDRTPSPPQPLAAKAKHADYGNIVLVYKNNFTFGLNASCAFFDICTPLLLSSGIKFLTQENKWVQPTSTLFIDKPHLYFCVTSAFVLMATFSANFIRQRMLSKITYDIKKKTFIGHKWNFMLMKKTFEFQPAGVVLNYPMDWTKDSASDVSLWKYALNGNCKINSKRYILLATNIKNTIYFNIMVGVSNKY